MNKQVCTYCNTVNELQSEACIACGAPLEKMTPLPAARSEPESFVIQPLENMNRVGELDSLQTTLKTITSSSGAILRTAGEALAVAFTAFGLGVTGATTDQASWAVLGAILAGVVVGVVEKNFWPTILGAPSGTLVGLIIGWIVWASGGGAEWMIFSCTAGALAGAIIGSHRRRTGANWQRLLRPVFWMSAAVIFVILGLLVGEGFQQVIRLLSGS